MTPLLSSALLRAQSDERLVELAAAGHDRAFEAIVERYRRPLLRYLRRLLSDTLAEDVAQATFINAWSSLRTGTEVRDLRPWLYRIAHNAAINALKKVGEAMEEVPESAGGFATEPATELERRDEMLHALTSIAALPSRQRTALLAVAIDGRAHADVAEELGLTDGAVRQLVHRARTTLRTAATAITPIPLLNAVVASAGDSTVARVAEVAAGAGGAGAASVSLKAGAAAVLATGALVTGGPEVAKVVHPAQKPSEPASGSASPLWPASGPGGGGSFAAPAVAPAADKSGSSSGSSKSGPGQSGRGHRQKRKGADGDDSGPSENSGRRRRAAADDRRGPGNGTAAQPTAGQNRGPDASGSGTGDDGARSPSSGGGTTGSGSSGNADDGADRDSDDGGGTSGEGSGSGRGDSREGSNPGDEDLVVTPPTITETTTTTESSSGQSETTTTTETTTETSATTETTTTIVTPSGPPPPDAPADPRAAPGSGGGSGGGG
jgi:RNA polymerase sigma factor (sigma-70 family)